MNISAEELAGIVTKAVEDSLAAERTNFRVPEKQHFLDHERLQQCLASSEEILANRAFVTELRSNIDVVKRDAFRSVMALLGIAVALAASYATAKLKGWM